MKKRKDRVARGLLIANPLVWVLVGGATVADGLYLFTREHVLFWRTVKTKTGVKL